MGKSIFQVMRILFKTILYQKFNIQHFIRVLVETITATRKELAENGIELPKFQKIAGLLSEDVKGDTITLHDAIMEINNAIMSQVIVLKLCFQFYI